MTTHFRRLGGQHVTVLLTLLVLLVPMLPKGATNTLQRSIVPFAGNWSGVGSYHLIVSQPQTEAYVRPDLAERMQQLRPVILAAAARHNRSELSGMSDHEFAAVIALIIYNENFGWFEEAVPPLRIFTPLYQDVQRQANRTGVGSNFSVWPTNLRPSVAIEILEQRIPLPNGEWAEVPLQVKGSRIDPAQYPHRSALMAAVTAEISRDELAVAYLAANLERGLYRAAYEDVAVDWRTLAAWHNQGIVEPEAIRENATASDYVRRAAAYLTLAEELVAP